MIYVGFYFLTSIILRLILCEDVDYSNDGGHLEVTLDERNVGEMRNICQNFSFGNIYSGEFSTPNYPDLYPADIECVRVIHAPPDHLIHLDFRGSVFEIERSESTDKCQFDYLEVRNGPYGFSPLIGKYCGKKYPPAITGDAGSMWLYFKSDRSLQYRGFKAVHYFSPAKDKAEGKIMCSFSNDPLDDDGIFSTDMMQNVFDQIINSTEPKVECVWKLETSSPEYKIKLQFEKFHLAFPNQCKINFLEVYGENTAEGHQKKQYCGRTAAIFPTNASKVYIRIHLGRSAIADTKISALYTVYVPGKNCSSDSLFPCGDDTCISTRLLCNGRSNCLSDNDERKCPQPPTPGFRQVYGPYLVILIVILLIIGIIISCIAIMNLCPRFNKRNVTYSPVPHSSTNLLSPSSSSSPPPMPLSFSPSMHSSAVDMVYSTVVPGPDHQGRLYELLPKMSSEDLHLYLCKQGCLLNGKLASNDNHVTAKLSDPPSSTTTTNKNPAASRHVTSASSNRIMEKRLRIVDQTDSIESSLSTPPPLAKSSKTPDVILNGLMKKKKRPNGGGVGNRSMVPKSKTVKFFKTDSLDDESSVEHPYQMTPHKKRNVSKSISHPTPLANYKYAEAGSSTDTLENLSQVAVNRITDSEEDSPLSALTATSPKSSASEGFVLSI